MPTPVDPQYPRLKAATPQPPQSVPRPSTATSPTSPTGAVPTDTAGQSGASTTPAAAAAAAAIDTDGEQQDETMGAQSISSGSTTSIATTIVMDIKSLMWDAITSAQCSPAVLQPLIDTELRPQVYTGNGDHVKAMTEIENTPAIQRDSFIPTAALNDTTNYLWFTWLTEAEYNDFNATGQVATRTLGVTMCTSITGCTIHQTTVSICTSTIGGTQPVTMTIMVAISRSSCSLGRRQSTQSWRTITIRPAHTVQFTSAVR
eukprot:1748018-Amphidinium_carterae.1